MGIYFNKQYGKGGVYMALQAPAVFLRTYSRVHEQINGQANLTHE